MTIRGVILLVFVLILNARHGSAATEVLPEITTRVEMSSSDINRIHCSHSQIGDVLFSDEKGIEVKINGKNAFLKFSAQQTMSGTEYKTKPAEIYVVCGNDMYILIAEPMKIPATTVRLSSSLRNRIKEAGEFFKGLAFEEKNRKLIEYAYTDSLPDFFKVTNVSERIGIFKEMQLMLIKTVRVEGEGILLKEYVFKNVSDVEMHVQEEDFLIKEITKNAVAISLDPHYVGANEKGRLFIVERVKEENTLLLFSEKQPKKPSPQKAGMF
jgi:conjugal transfer pilus assembly protein TraK